MIARAMYLPCSVALVALMALPARGHQCINAPGQTECGRQVEKAMLEGFAKHPNKYVGLTIHSTYTDFQAYFHNAGMHDCPRPCFPQEEECVKFSSTYPGMAKVAWARDVGMAKHPEWYPELSSHSSDKQIARALYMHGIEGCPRVCEDDEVEGHFEPFYEGVQVAESESWMKGAQQAATEPPTTQAPTMPPTELPTTQAPITTPVPTLPPSTQAPTPAPTPEPTTTPAPTTTAALTQAPTPAPTTTTEAPAATPAPTTQAPAPAPLPSLPSIHQGSKKPACFKVGYSYTLLDCLNHVPSITGSREDCKAHCAGFKEASYFLFHVPLSLCHCPPASASPIEDMGPDYIGGSMTCDAASYMKRNDADVPVFGTVPKFASAMSNRILVIAAAAAAVAMAMGAIRLGTRLTCDAPQEESVRLLGRTTGELEALEA